MKKAFQRMSKREPETLLPQAALEILASGDYAQILSRIDRDYLHWDKVKYIAPAGLKAEDLWTAVKLQRRMQAIRIEFAGKAFFLKTTAWMQEALHRIDMDYRGAPAGTGGVGASSRQGCLLSSAMEEAIASSQMEGASTTRKVAKEMLRRGAKPKDAGQQMIVNNYRTIRYVAEQKDAAMTPALLLEIHRRITRNTLKDSSAEGSFRHDDNIFVANALTGDIVHEPPPCASIPKAVEELCAFANGGGPFIHPAVKAIVLHFMVSYLHPFADGNGRTARALFHWHMLKSGFGLAEYLSVSRIIQKTRRQYEKAFLHVEHDGLDLGYFVQYNLKALEQAFAGLKEYLERKAGECGPVAEYLAPGLNGRQSLIARICSENRTKVYTSAEIAAQFGVSVKTARADLEGMAKIGLMETVSLNQRMRGYVRGSRFDEAIREIRGN